MVVIIPGASSLPVPARADTSAKSSDAYLISTLHGTTIAAMLFGSEARGTAGKDSDIDILQIVPRDPESYSVGRVNVTQYLASQLKRMASDGSLFVLHLKNEGKILVDDFGVLRRCMDGFDGPRSFITTVNEIALVGSALDPNASDHVRFIPGLGRLGVYLLRTYLYAFSVNQNLATFDVDKIVETLGNPGLKQAVDLRHSETFSVADVALLHNHLCVLIGKPLNNQFATIEALAVSLGNNPRVGPLLASLLTGKPELDYSAISLPPF